MNNLEGISQSTEYVWHDNFRNRNYWQTLTSPDISVPDIPPFQLQIPIKDEDHPARKPRPVNLTADQEKTLFLRYNYAKYMLDKASKNGRKDMALWQARAEDTRDKIVHANLALVPAMAKRMRSTDIEFTELVSEGHMAILRAVEKFDVSRGFKFSTYACRSILKSFSRMAEKNARDHAKMPVPYDSSFDRSDHLEQVREDTRRDYEYTVREIVYRNLAGLSKLERGIITRRFGFYSKDGKTATLRDLGKSIGLSNERVRQVQNVGLAKIRKYMGKMLGM